HVAPGLLVVDEDGRVLVLERTDEALDEAAEEGLLEEDEEHEQTDRAGEQAEADLGAGDLAGGQEHGRRLESAPRPTTSPPAARIGTWTCCDWSSSADRGGWRPRSARRRGSGGCSASTSPASRSRASITPWCRCSSTTTRRPSTASCSTRRWWP